MKSKEMNDRQRFHALMSYESYDRLPIYFFGTWPETRGRWFQEGLPRDASVSSGAPQLEGMDLDWEHSPDDQGQIWNSQGMIRYDCVTGDLDHIVEETNDYAIIRKGTGGLVKHSKSGSSISQHIEPDLKPTRKDWERFKAMLDPNNPKRFIGTESRAKWLDSRTHVTCFFAGSLFGWFYKWMGLEGVSLLPFDDPDLFDEMIGYMADYFIKLNTPLLKTVQFDFGYIFEDCCFKTGPLISPEVYKRFFDPHYRRMLDAYRALGVPWLLFDSDGKIDDLLPHWLETGFDIIFPIEVGTWQADPVHFRRKYGRKMRMMGGFDKHIIPQGANAIRQSLEQLKPIVEEGGYIPLPDHRIPPDVSLDQMRTYLDVFKEVFHSE